MDTDLAQRYSRHIKLPQIGEQGQQKLLSSSVLLVGLGGLGSPVALYLAAAGVGKLGLADFDVVDESNLQRQVIHQQQDIGELKTDSAALSIKAINPSTQVEIYSEVLDGDDFMALAKEYDLFVDCSDNFTTRFELNDVALKTKTPIVSAAAIRWEGQVTSFDSRNVDSPCYQCLYPDRDITAGTCAREGVVAPLVGVIGSMQAMEAVNVLLDNTQLNGVVWLFDAYAMQWQRMRLKRNPNCKACGD